jgi:hypothetical protein
MKLFYDSKTPQICERKEISAWFVDQMLNWEPEDAKYFMRIMHPINPSADFLG